MNDIDIYFPLNDYVNYNGDIKRFIEDKYLEARGITSSKAKKTPEANDVNSLSQNVTETKTIASRTKEEIEKYIGNPTDDIEILKANAKKYYEENLKTTTGKNKAPVNPKAGKIEFSNTGLKKELFNTHYERLKTLPFLRDVIEKGEASDIVKDDKHEFIDGWIYIKGNVDIEGKPFTIQIDVAVDEFGNRFYVSNDITKKEANTNQPSIKAAASASDNSINNKINDVNTFDSKDSKITEEEEMEETKKALDSIVARLDALEGKTKKTEDEIKEEEKKKVEEAAAKKKEEEKKAEDSKAEVLAMVAKRDELYNHPRRAF
ncbi:MAG: hypothetical protein LBQ47_02790 [Endomicrobium sp.]|jgi:hypothetical protein|nr:hypothetical protein [Endomicrobium sp.]